MKKTVFYIGSILLGAMLLYFSLNALHYVGVASAQVPADPANPTQSDVIAFLTSGQYLPAVGAILVLVIGLLRKTLGTKFAWFTTQMGGYILSYVTTMLIYIGTSFEQGQTPTLKLIWMAIVASIGSSGLLMHWRDAKDSIKKVPPVVGAATALFIGLGAVTVLGGSTSCGSSPPRPIADIIDCAKQDSAQISAAEAKCASLIPDWSATEACVIGELPTIGWQVGGCVLADIAQQYLTKKGAAQDMAGTVKAHNAMDDYRAKYGHSATFRVKGQDL